MFSKHLTKVINRNSYVKDWRFKTAVCLVALGMSETGIESAITGNLDRRKECHNLCRAEGLEFKKVWALIE